MHASCRGWLSRAVHRSSPFRPLTRRRRDPSRTSQSSTIFSPIAESTAVPFALKATAVTAPRDPLSCASEPRRLTTTPRCRSHSDTQPDLVPHARRPARAFFDPRPLARSLCQAAHVYALRKCSFSTYECLSAPLAVSHRLTRLSPLMLT